MRSENLEQMLRQVKFHIAAFTDASAPYINLVGPS